MVALERFVLLSHKHTSIQKEKIVRTKNHLNKKLTHWNNYKKWAWGHCNVQVRNILAFCATKKCKSIRNIQKTLKQWYIGHSPKLKILINAAFQQNLGNTFEKLNPFGELSIPFIYKRSWWCTWKMYAVCVFVCVWGWHWPTHTFARLE